MTEENVDNSKSGQFWHVDLDWYQQSGRSFYFLARGCLCPSCRERLMAGGTEITDTGLLTAIKDCCSREHGFITGRLPLLECVFRLFLANGNQPLATEELARQLNDRLGEYGRQTSAEVLSRILSHDR